jgi:hypothetical protein
MTDHEPLTPEQEKKIADLLRRYYGTDDAPVPQHIIDLVKNAPPAKKDKAG